MGTQGRPSNKRPSRAQAQDEGCAQASLSLNASVLLPVKKAATSETTATQLDCHHGKDRCSAARAKMEMDTNRTGVATRTQKPKL